MLYRERLWPAWWVFLATGLVIPASLLVFLPINPFAGVAAAVVLYGGIVTVLLVTTPAIEVDERMLRVGRARIERRFLGDPVPSTGAAAFAERGPDLDARAYLVLRGWLPGVVRIPLTDPDDPTPYWLVSTRNPQALADALRA